MIKKIICLFKDHKWFTIHRLRICTRCDKRQVLIDYLTEYPGGAVIGNLKWKDHKPRKVKG